MDKRLVKEIDEVVKSALGECKGIENSEVAVPNNAVNVGRALRSQLRKHLRSKNDPLSIRDMREEIFDWNIRSLMVDYSCFTLDELSAKFFGERKVNYLVGIS